MKFQNKLKLLFAFSAWFVLAQCVFGNPVNKSLDSLRIAIVRQQASLDSVQQVRSTQMLKFSEVNGQINEYKIELGKQRQPLLEFRLNAALKKSRELADKISILDARVNQIKVNLQELYKQMIATLDTEIRSLLSSSNSKTPNQAALNSSQRLSKEKSGYFSRLNSIKINVSEWQNITIEANDSPQRIMMKTTLLKDKAARLERVILQDEERLRELEKDKKMQNEMLVFYLDLSRTLEDEQGIFDRDRLEELKDQSENFAREIQIIKSQISENKLNSVNLYEKISRFTQAWKKKLENY
ncbi:MAG: hypothetical protein DWQ05_21620 [Calditrichaeota bacterium]|nr:MAG: hypothetical protein DWQ05_21620 [Calditrichota bacterium]